MWWVELSSVMLGILCFAALGFVMLGSVRLGCVGLSYGEHFKLRYVLFGLDWMCFVKLGIIRYVMLRSLAIS